jgi:hypothetical protein
MTISTTQNQITYTGDAVTLAFSFPYPFITTADIKVYVDGVQVVVGFTVSGTSPVGGSGTFSSGTVTFVAAPANGATVLLFCDPDLLQSTSLPPNDPFPSKTVEKMADKLTLLIQRLKTAFGNAITFPPGEIVDGVLPDAATRASKALTFDASGNVQLVAPADGTATALALLLAASAGSSLVGFINSGVGGVARTLEGKSRDIFDARDYGAAPGASTAANRAALQLTITAAAAYVAATGNTAEVIIRDGYGLETDVRATWPSFSGVVVPLVVRDFSRGDTYGVYPAAYDGAQQRVWMHTPQTTTPGQHDGNGSRHCGAWAPYLWIDNNADLTGPRAATDNRRASLYTGVNGKAVWMLGQGTLDSAAATDTQLSNFHLRLFGTTFGLPFNDIDTVIVDATTGHWWFNIDSNTSDAAYHLKQRTLGYYGLVVEGLTQNVDAVIRNSDGTGDDIAVRNANGSLALRIVGVGDGVMVDRNRRVTINQSFVEHRIALVYSASMAIDANLGNFFTVIPTNGVAFAFQVPTNPADGQRLTIRITNTTGGALGAATFTAGANGFRAAAWTQPATGNSRSITFQYDGSVWCEIGRCTADIPN